MSDLRQHYAAVRARLNKAPPAPAPTPAPEPVAPGPDIEAAIRRNRELLAGCPLPRRLQLLVLLVLDEADMTWVLAMSRARRPQVLAVRQAIFKLLVEEGWGIHRIAEAVDRDPSTVRFTIADKAGTLRKAKS